MTVDVRFHRWKSVLGAGLRNEQSVYDEACIRERGHLIGYAIDAWSRRFPQETPYQYEPFSRWADRWCWDDQAKAPLADYNLLDLSIWRWRIRGRAPCPRARGQGARALAVA